MASISVSAASPTTQARKKYLPAIGPRLKVLLFILFGLFALTGVNSVYLVSITILERATGLTYENYFYQYMFLLHLVLGVTMILPVLVFGVSHIYNAHNRPNRRAVRAGFALFATSLLLLASGVILMRLEGIIVIKDALVRSIAYWAHVLSPLVIVWLFILHRLAGRKIKWKIGLSWAAVAGAFALAMTVLHAQDPRQWNKIGPKTGEKYFFPSLAKTATGNFIPAEVLTNNEYCLKCHADIYKNWSHSVHRFSSFNNPPYTFSVKNTRKVMFGRDGNVHGSRFCAGCHDPVPFFSGAFDQPKFDDPNYNLASDPLAQAGISCTVCHAITHVNSNRGNADYTIDEPEHYPFAFSENPVLQWINNQLIKGKPEFHKKTFLKPLHKSAEFCGTCHKVHLPEELNHYKFLRGQNHYDTYLLSGVSGHGVQSFYYPPKAKHNCAECHMPLHESTDFGAKDFDGTGVRKVHQHQFPTANTAIPHLLGMPPEVNEAHRKFLEGVMRVDLFGVKEGGTIDSPLIAPLRPEVPALARGREYILDAVIRTVKMGHPFTQGTADSNEIWLDLKVTSGDRIIARSGGLKADDRDVDPWAHFINAFVIDRNGNRIDRRNPEDIFIPLYSHQIPPGAADVLHYRLKVPDDVVAPIVVEAKLQYRKFDTTYMRIFQAEEFVTNDLPITTLAVDRITFPIEGLPAVLAHAETPVPPWERWNDYGIGLLRKGETGSNKGELRQAEAAFAQVEKLGRPDGPLNSARVYNKEGRLEDAVDALRRAAAFNPPAPPWSVAWFTGLVNKQNGRLDEAIKNFTAIIEMKDTEECRKREFDFSQDYVLMNELGSTLFERGKQERGAAGRAARDDIFRSAVGWFEKTLLTDPENIAAHYNLAQLLALLGDDAQSEQHRKLHAKYKPDDNASDHAIAAARMKYPAANHAAEAIVIYDLQREGAYELPSTAPVLTAKAAEQKPAPVASHHAQPARAGGAHD